MAVEDIVGDGGILKEIVQEGTGFETPEDGDEVFVHYTGKLASDGTVFDSSVERGEPFTFKLGKGSVIKGWDKGVATMKKGEKAVFTLRADYAYGEGGSPPKIPGGATLVFDIELLRWKNEEAVTDDETIMKRVLKAGDGWQRPKFDTKVKIRYALAVGGAVKDERDAFEFVVGEETCPRGLERGVESMKLGERARLRVQAGPWGYGAAGCAELGVPGDAELVYDVELLEMEKEKSSWEMAPEERLAACREAKEQGNALFKAGKLDRAEKKYDKAVGFIEHATGFEGDAKAERDALKVPLQLNLAAVFLAKKEYRKAIKDCKEVLKMDPGNVKAHYRLGCAYHGIDEWDEAKKCLNAVLEREKENKAAIKELARVKRKIKAHEEKQKKLFKNMFA